MNIKFWFLMGCSLFMTVAGIGGSLTGWYCAPLFFCTAMIIDEIAQHKKQVEIVK